MKTDRVKKDEFEISTDPARLDFKMVHAFLQDSYWASGISFEKVRASLENSFCFGVYKAGEQVGFARVITDFARFGYLADVFIIEEYRGLGLAKWLMQTIMHHPDLRGIMKWCLMTQDAHGLYEQVGFKAPASPEMYMELNNQPEKMQ